MSKVNNELETEVEHQEQVDRDHQEPKHYSETSTDSKERVDCAEGVSSGCHLGFGVAIRQDFGFTH